MLADPDLSAPKNGDSLFLGSFEGVEDFGDADACYSCMVNAKSEAININPCHAIIVGVSNSSDAGEHLQLAVNTPFLHQKNVRQPR